MGWNTSALFVRAWTVEQLIDFLPDVFSYEATDEAATAEEAWCGSPGERLYLAEAHGWCQMWDPDQRFAPRLSRMIERPRDMADTQALAVLFDGVSSTYSFWLYENGELTRQATFESGNCIEQTGTALPIESQVAIPSWGHDEDFLWAVITAVTGLKDDTEQLFNVYSVD